LEVEVLYSPGKGKSLVIGKGVAGDCESEGSNLCRADVLPADNLGLARAVSIHYLAGAMPSRPILMALAEQWRPWRSLATWFLWRSLDAVPVEY